MIKLAIIHTTPATVESLKTLALEFMPDCTVINFVDDSILPQLAENGGDLTQVEERLLAYARFAEEVGAEIVLEACSSVGEVTKKIRSVLSIPVVRIDDVMVETAVQRGTKIGVAATLKTTLNPTSKLLLEKAQQAGKEIQLHPLLVNEAYQALLAGDRQQHDFILSQALAKLAHQTEVVVLAQASMAGVLNSIPREEQQKFLSSPRLAMQALKDMSDLIKAKKDKGESS
jgi:aspartate/glutamate racemase